VIKGDRVTLRAITPADYPRLLEFKHDVEFELAGGGDPPRPRTLAGATEFFDELLKDRDVFTFGIEADGKLIGDLGLFHVNRVNGSAELGIGIGDKAYWGNGYGREAIALLVDYGFRLLNLRRIWLEVHANNDRAMACYRSCGFAEEGRLREHVWTDGKYVDLVVMGLLRDA